eukprot:9473884-Pyramimonas_sp.AAC.3
MARSDAESAPRRSSASSAPARRTRCRCASASSAANIELSEVAMARSSRSSAPFRSSSVGEEGKPSPPSSALSVRKVLSTCA